MSTLKAKYMRKLLEIIFFFWLIIKNDFHSLCYRTPVWYSCFQTVCFRYRRQWMQLLKKIVGRHNLTFSQTDKNTDFPTTLRFIHHSSQSAEVLERCSMPLPTGWPSRLEWPNLFCTNLFYTFKNDLGVNGISFIFMACNGNKIDTVSITMTIG